jgi:hypothetical protein
MNQSPGYFVFKQMQNAQCKIGCRQIGDSSSPVQLDPCTWDRLHEFSHLVPFPVVDNKMLVR